MLAGAGASAVAMLWAGTAVSWNLAPSDTAMYWTIGLLLASLLVVIPVISALNSATRGAVSLAERQLDERQVAERLRAYTVAHRVTLVVMAAVMAVVYFVTSGGREASVPMAAVGMCLVSLFFTQMVAPVLVAGWRQADPPPEDEDED
ncbi:MAG TPA: hypothetical protein VKY91_08095 [Vulgatibacteraceae bacterium]|nr:hypothetical protein [Vulgatibacteraceae bacterium]